MMVKVVIMVLVVSGDNGCGHIFCEEITFEQVSIPLKVVTALERNKIEADDKEGKVFL